MLKMIAVAAFCIASATGPARAAFLTFDGVAHGSGEPVSVTLFLDEALSPAENFEFGMTLSVDTEQGNALVQSFFDATGSGLSAVGATFSGNLAGFTGFDGPFVFGSGFAGVTFTTPGFDPAGIVTTADLIAFLNDPDLSFEGSLTAALLDFSDETAETVVVEFSSLPIPLPGAFAFMLTALCAGFAGRGKLFPAPA